MVTAGILPFRENSHGRTGNRTQDLMISSQRLWPLDHEDGSNNNNNNTSSSSFVITFIQGIYKYISETNHVSRV